MMAERGDRAVGTGRIDVSVIIISYNTRDLTMECLRSLYRETRDISFEVIVIDNDSSDGSAEAIAEEFSQVHLEALRENQGFGGGCNYAAEKAAGDYLLMLNPDTVVLDAAIQKLVHFARKHPETQLFGGRTLWGDGSLNPTSCWRRPTPWSVFCRASGLSVLFNGNAWFDSETYGAWQRDDVREIDVVTGCLMLIDRDLWREMKGFDPAFFQRGEDADFCMRARQAGYRALHCPEAVIIHYGGQSERVAADKITRNLLAKQLIFDRNWTPFRAKLGRSLQRTWVLERWLYWWLAGLLGKGESAERAGAFREVWARRDEWKGLS